MDHVALINKIHTDMLKHPRLAEMRYRLLKGQEPQVLAVRSDRPASIAERTVRVLTDGEDMLGYRVTMTSFMGDGETYDHAIAAVAERVASFAGGGDTERGARNQHYMLLLVGPNAEMLGGSEWIQLKVNVAAIHMIHEDPACPVPQLS